MGQKEYLEEFEKYKNIPLNTGMHKLKNQLKEIKYEILEILEDGVIVESQVLNKFKTKKTLHWARKNLIPIES